ncbi:MAG TPA: nicotinate-nucleotide adenylyltransferase [Thermomicrobiales bacterium]|nr:nicotinate-nucleotide adenylyltransferase [Thermomicrobiales bacterium]
MGERIGVFGGTFDPIHHGHLIAAAELRHALRVDRVLFVPASRPPHKQSAVQASDQDRLAMLRLAIARDEGFQMSMIEYERAGLSYTVDTLAALRDEYPGALLFLFLGEDALRDLPTWHRPEGILSLARLGIATRPRSHLDLDVLYRALPGTRGRIELVPTPSIGISATDLRARVADGRPIRYQTPDAVIDYIRQHGIYRR